MVNNENSAQDRTSKGLVTCPVCQKPSDKKCSGCHSVSYCSSEHQKRHWKLHKRECRTFRVKHNESYGRYLVATRDIPQGTTIFTEEPLTYGPKRCTYPVCLGCHKRVFDGCYRCSKCTYPMCSEECEKAPIHAENECIIFQRATHPVGSKISNFDAICPAYECITPLRCLLLRERNPSKWEKLTSMEHHNNLRKSVPGLWNRNQVNVVKLLLEWCKMKDDEVDEEIVHSVMGYIDVNCFEIKFKNVEICGIYRDAGLMCHDCVPNTHQAITVTSEHKMIVRSSVPIRKGDMITTSYANQLTGTRERRFFLKDTKYFDCLCQRCQDATEFATYISDVKCTDCSTGYLLPKDPLSVHSTGWVCSNVSSSNEPQNGNSKANGNVRCSKTMKDEQLQCIVKKAQKDIDEVSRSTAGSLTSRLERILKKYSGKVLHPNHYVLLNVVKSLNYAYASMHGGNNGEVEKEELDLDRLTRAKALCLQMQSVLDMIDPGLSRLRGVTLFHMALSDFQISRIKFQKGEISREEYKKGISNILTYLQTSREILELDKLITQNLMTYSLILEQYDAMQDTLNSLG